MATIEEREELLEYDGGLLRFLRPTQVALSVLVVESLSYLPKLREMLPKAALFAVTAEPERAEVALLQDLDVSWSFLDYREVALPFAHGSFDYIISDRCLETAGNPQDIAAGFGLYLQPTGYFLTSFLNVRHWSVLEDLRKGHFYAIVRRIFARLEIETLMAASFYKEVSFLPVLFEASQEVLARWESVEFENQRRDLDVKFWLCCARRTADEIAPLKECFTPAVRRRLVTLLRRLEYGIETTENAASFWQLYRTEGIFPEYLFDFAEQTIVHLASLFKTLLQTAEPSLARELIKTAHRKAVADDVRKIFHTFAKKLEEEVTDNVC